MEICAICKKEKTFSNDSTQSKIRLSDIASKKFCKIVDVCATPQLRRRLFELGFVCGAVVQVINISPMSRAYLINVQDSLLCIRASVLAHILVEPFNISM